jgi:virginiamycin A acetyltransferase
MPDIPSPDTLHPVAGHPRVVFLKPLVRSPNIEVGDYTYYDDPGDPAAFERENVLYAYGPERLVIGRYCALATRVRFLMADANHPTAGVSTFPFAIFGGAWAEQTLDLVQAIPSRGDTSPVTMSGSATKRWSCRVSGSVTARSSRPRWW